MVKMILTFGIPTGIENGMFQFGKLAIQSTVSTLGTTAIAAQAMTSVLEGFSSMAGVGIGLGMVTICLLYTSLYNKVGNKRNRGNNAYQHHCLMMHLLDQIQI